MARAVIARGLLFSYETGVYRGASDYRIPDVAVYEPARATQRGIDGPAVFVVEIRSPGDETGEKILWYAGLGVREVLAVDRDGSAVELHGHAGSSFGPTVHLATLGVSLTAGPPVTLRGPGDDAIRLDG